MTALAAEVAVRHDQAWTGGAVCLALVSLLLALVERR